MADEDFFKDYPPVGGDEAESRGAPILMGGEDGGLGGGALNGGGGGDGGDDGGGGDDGDVSGDASGDASGEEGGGDGGFAGDGADAAAAAAEEDGGGAGGGAAAECAAVTAWRAQFAAGLESKLGAERAGKAERAEAARAALERMHAGWEGRCRDARERNAAGEKEMVRERDGVLARMSKPGEKPNWAVVPELVDMSGKFKEGQRDTSRMRQVLLKLKTY